MNKVDLIDRLIVILKKVQRLYTVFLQYFRRNRHFRLMVEIEIPAILSGRNSAGITLYCSKNLPVPVGYRLRYMHIPG